MTAPEPAEKPHTRRRLSFWDRTKFLLLFVAAWFALVWAAVAGDPILPFSDAVRLRVRDTEGIVIMVLLGLELVRQLHSLISEQAPAYHRLWIEGVFGGLDRATHRKFSDWTRFRLLSAFTWLPVIAVVALIVGLVLKTSPFPDDVKTRFSDVGGQDHVLQRVKENIVYLDPGASITRWSRTRRSPGRMSSRSWKAVPVRWWTARSTPTTASSPSWRIIPGPRRPPIARTRSRT